MTKIFSPDIRSEFLSDEAYQHDELERLSELAEIYVITRYRGERFSEAREHDVLLAGWAETDDGVPDVDAMPDDLVRRLRLVIGEVIEHRLRDDGREDISRLVEGGRQVFYDTSTPSLPSRLFWPLDRYDQREGLTGFW